MDRCHNQPQAFLQAQQKGHAEHFDAAKLLYCHGLWTFESLLRCQASQMTAGSGVLVSIMPVEWLRSWPVIPKP